MPKLTDKGVAAFAPTDKRREIADTLCPGLYLIIQPSGSKSWAVRYRVDGRAVKDTVGRYPNVSLAEARLEAANRLRAVHRGEDPREVREAAKRAADERKARTFRVISEEFIEKYAKRRNRHWKDTQSVLIRYCVPAWGDRPIDKIRRRDIADLMDEIVAGGHPYAARHTLAALKKLFAWCLDRELIEVSPAIRMQPPIRVAKRERVLTDKEIAAVWSACENIGYPYGPFVRLLLLTGCRRGEIAEAVWSDMDGKVLTIPAERYKTGIPHAVPLSTMAQEVLATVPRIKGQAHLFSTRGDRPISGFGKMQARLCAVADVTFTPHDLRRTVRTGLSRLRIADHVAERVIGHVQGGVAAHYDHWSYIDEKREALELWARHVEGTIRPSPGNVVAIREAANA